MSSAAIVQKLWNYCNVLSDDGLGYEDYEKYEKCQVYFLSILLFQSKDLTLFFRSSQILKRE